jgi:glutaredoxin 3
LQFSAQPLLLKVATAIYGARNFGVLAMPKIEVYSTAQCPYCVAAKNLLKAKGLAWEEVRVDTDPAMRETMLARSGGRRTVPQIFINDQLVGGYDDLVAADRSGKLAQLLGAAA